MGISGWKNPPYKRNKERKRTLSKYQERDQTAKKGDFQKMKSLSYDEAHDKMAEQIKKGVEPQIVTCILGEFKIMGKATEIKTRRGTNIKYLDEYLPVDVFNKGTGIWQRYKAVEHYGACPVCGKLLLVRAIKGSTYFYACNKEHTEQGWKEHLELMKKHTIKTSALIPISLKRNNTIKS